MAIYYAHDPVGIRRGPIDAEIAPARLGEHDEMTLVEGFRRDLFTGAREAFDDRQRGERSEELVGAHCVEEPNRPPLRNVGERFGRGGRVLAARQLQRAVNACFIERWRQRERAIRYSRASRRSPRRRARTARASASRARNSSSGIVRVSPARVSGWYVTSISTFVPTTRTSRIDDA